MPTTPISDKRCCEKCYHGFGTHQGVCKLDYKCPCHQIIATSISEELRSGLAELAQLTKSIEEEIYGLVYAKRRGLSGISHVSAKDNLSRQFNEKLLSLITNREEKAYQKGLEKGALKGERNRIISQLREEIEKEARDGERKRIVDWVRLNNKPIEHGDHECHMYCCGNCWCQDKDGAISLRDLLAIMPLTPNPQTE